MLKLYYAAHTCSLATHIVLEEVGADYSTVRVDFATEQQKSPEFLRVNPKARVPALETVTFTPQMADLLRGAGDVAALQPLIDQARGQGCQTLDQSLVDLAHAGTIAVDQALLASEQPDALRTRITGVTAAVPLQAIGKVDDLPF